VFKLIQRIRSLLKPPPPVREDLHGRELLDIILCRRSIRSFTPDPLAPEEIDAILEAGRQAPSTVNLQTWSFVVLSRDEWAAAFASRIPFGGDRAVVICADLHRLSLALGPALNGTLMGHTLAVFNAGLAAMNMTVAAEALGVGSIMLSETGRTGFLDIDYLKEHLRLPRGVTPLCTLVLGRPSRRPTGAPPRFPTEAVVHRARYAEPTGDAVQEWREQMRLGYRLSHGGRSLDAKIRYYLSRLQSADEQLKRAIFSQT